MSKESVSQPSLADVFRNRNFVKFWVGQVISYLGDRIDQMAMITIVSMGVSRAAGSDRANMITFWATLPYVMVSPFAGVIIDRYCRRKMMVLMDVLRAAAVLIVPFVVSPGVHPWIVYAVIGLIGAATSIFAPAKSAFIPEIVERDHLLRANSVTSIMGTLTVLFGTVIGGELVARIGYRPSLVIDGLSYLFSAAMLLWIRVPGRERSETEARWRELKAEGGFFSNIRDGFRYVTGKRVPGMCVFLDSWFFLVGGILFTLINKIVYLRITPAGADESRTIEYLGYAYGALGIGLALGGVLTGRYGNRLRLRWLLSGCFCGAALFMFALILKAHPVLIYAFLFGVGYAAGGVVVCIETTLQKAVPDEIRGRVFALNNLLLNTTLLVSIALGTFILEYRFLGVDQTLLATALLTLAGAGVVLWRFPGQLSLASMRVFAAHCENSQNPKEVDCCDQAS